MPPRIAIVGSCHPSRAEELGLRRVDQARAVCEKIGAELARQGYQIVVYSSHPQFIESDIVRGYISVENRKKGCIQVRYVAGYEDVRFKEQETYPDCFESRAERAENWEITFYHSLFRVDGVLLIGGGLSTLISGIIALGHKKPMVACGGFGGFAERVYSRLKEVQNEYGLSEDQLTLMLNENWREQDVKEIIELLKVQMTHFKKQARDAQKTRQQKIVNQHLLASIPAILVGGGVAVASQGESGWGESAYTAFLFLLTVCFGALGALMSVVFKDYTHRLDPKKVKPAQNTLGVGAFAGLVAGLFFIAPYLTAGVTDSAIRLSRIYDFLMLSVILTSVAAGAAFENIFKRLAEVQKLDVVGDLSQDRETANPD